MIYLDNASTTKANENVQSIIDKYNSQLFFNPSSVYRPAVEVRRDIENSRHILAHALNVNDNNIIFTSSATESNNLAILGGITAKKDAEYIFSMGEHPSVYNIAKQLEQQGKVVHYCPLKNDGTLDEVKLFNLISSNTAMICFIHINNETGAINNVKEIVQRIKEINNNIYVHVDGVQAFMKMPVDLMDLNVDSYAISAHKITATKGVGAVYIKNIQKHKPILFGGGQENNLRSSTENVAGIVAFGETVKLLENNIEIRYEHVTELKNIMLNYFNNHLTDYINNANGSPYILNISVKGIKAEVILHILSDLEIYISAGSACSSKKKASRVLENMHIQREYLEGSLRISFLWTNTKEEVLQASKIIDDEIKKLREKLK